MTGLYCCDCGRELEHNEDVTVIAGAYIEYEFGEYVTMPTNEPSFSTLCKDCSSKVLSPKPNRVAVEVYKGRVVNVMAERPSPSEIVVTVLNYDVPIVATDDSGREHLTVLQDVWGTDDRPIKQLNTVEEGIPWAEYQPFTPEI